MSIHTIAEKYLRELKRGNDRFYAPPDNAEVQPVSEKVSERVLVIKEKTHEYLAGVTPSGRLVFTDDVLRAASYDSSSMKLVDVLLRMEHHEIPVVTMPACWFNHQR